MECNAEVCFSNRVFSHQLKKKGNSVKENAVKLREREGRKKERKCLKSHALQSPHGSALFQHQNSKRKPKV